VGSAQTLLLLEKPGCALTEGPITLMGLVNRISGISKMSRISGQTLRIPRISRILRI